VDAVIDPRVPRMAGNALFLLAVIKRCLCSNVALSTRCLSSTLFVVRSWGKL
jgi:hypothetical protein